MPRSLIKNLSLMAIFILFGCQNEAVALSHGRLATPSGQIIRAEIAKTQKEQIQGLSGRKKNSLKENQGMLFVYKNEAIRSFWMPDTYFDLDIIFLSKDLKIVQIERKVPHHPGRTEPPVIARTKPVFCHYVLEMNATSKISKALKVGSSLKWLEKVPLAEIGLDTRL